MTNFSTNQVMQFYVHTDGHKLYIPTNEDGEATINGPFSIAITTDGAAPAADGKNAIGRTDKIENVMWATLTKAEKLQTPYKEVTLTFKNEINEGAPIVGQDYIVKVSYPAIGGVGIEGFTTKVATAYASAGATSASIVEELAKNLNSAFEADGVLEAKVGKTEDELVITQTNIAEKSYERGVRPVTIADFNVTAAPVIKDGEEVDWLKKVIAPSTTAFVNGGYKLADMEYFALGERGDEYRMMGYPNYVKTTYRINPAEKYDVYNIHYAYKGYNDQSHKSEKDLIIAVPADDADFEKAIKTALSALGVTLEVVKKQK